jgi:VIT1/CCC1 family predicted Fe2+/Mn2+ transporter
MAAGEWISVSAQNELVTRELEIERRELRVNTAAETHELAKIYEGHGIEPDRAAAAAADVMRKPDVALAVHAREELGVDPGVLPSPWQAAVLSLVCFLFGAILPVIPWFIGGGGAAKVTSILIGVVAAAVVGAVIGRFAERRIAWSSIRQVLILLVACGVTYLIGQLLDVSVS